ncbi:hypothetical protein L486_01204 [Kwoniella mangroviensis CBS 10435]|uniref:Pentatricopeptide repeat domain-containing protein n=1 Tax=Kwoniella mangroviensis CBS 10435 TaxID=1331196 RepID=A0A1B9J1A7_9TREE|nr:hypothetical protein L486_01204 [Kwoniella mangroviensis CBS 10435]
MSSAQRNALYVLRMVWRDRQISLARRSVSTATATVPLTIQPDHSSSTTSTSTAPSRSPIDNIRSDNVHSLLPIDASSTTSTPSFLEPESDEYTTANLLLPERQLHPEPIPWPTLFPNSNVITTQSKFCDPIYRLVARDRYKDALTIYKEILSHNIRIQKGLLGHSIRIQHRHEYLKPAIRALVEGDHQSTLLWLNIYPNRPATTNHPVLKEIWKPVLDIVINEKESFKEDPQFLQEFMVLVGKKGLLPTFLPHLLPHLTFAFPPETSVRILGESIKAYVNSTTSDNSQTDRARHQEDVVHPQITAWWGSYLRKLIIAGWKEQALNLAHKKPFGGHGEWDDITRKFIDEELLEVGRKKKDESLRITDTTDIIQRIRATLRDLPTPTELSTMIRALSHPLIAQDHPNLLNRFESRFTRPPTIGSRRRRNTPTVQSKLWIHSEIINLQKEGNHHQAVDCFRENFFWVGLPPLETIYEEPKTPIGNPRSKTLPNIQLITTIIPSVVYTLPRPKSKTVKQFYSSYMSLIDNIPPSIRPNQVTYSTLLRELAHHSGSMIGLLSLRGLIEKGMNPGQESYAAVLYALAGRRHPEQMWDLLDQAEKEGMVGSRTYRGLLAILVKTGLAREAEKVFWRAREKTGREDVFDELDVQ